MLKIKMNPRLLRAKPKRIKIRSERSQSCRDMMSEEFLMLKKISLSQESPQIMTIPKRTIQREKMNLEETYQTKINRRSGKAGAADHAPGDEKREGDLEGDQHHLRPLLH